MQQNLEQKSDTKSAPSVKKWLSSSGFYGGMVKLVRVSQSVSQSVSELGGLRWSVSSGECMQLLLDQNAKLRLLIVVGVARVRVRVRADVLIVVVVDRVQFAVAERCIDRGNGLAVRAES